MGPDGGRGPFGPTGPSGPRGKQIEQAVHNKHDKQNIPENIYYKIYISKVSFYLLYSTFL